MIHISNFECYLVESLLLTSPSSRTWAWVSLVLRAFLPSFLLFWWRVFLQLWHASACGKDKTSWHCMFTLVSILGTAQVAGHGPCPSRACGLCRGAQFHLPWRYTPCRALSSACLECRVEAGEGLGQGFYSLALPPAVLWFSVWMNNVACYSSKLRMFQVSSQPPDGPQRDSWWEKAGHSPQIAEVNKGVILISPVSCLFPYREKH